MTHHRRNFERMFPGINQDEVIHLKTTLAEGRTAADREQQNKYENVTEGMGGELIGTFIYDFEKETEIFIPKYTKTNKEIDNDAKI